MDAGRTVEWTLEVDGNMLKATLTNVAPLVTFTAVNSVNLDSPTNLVFNTNDHALLTGYTFVGVSFAHGANSTSGFGAWLYNVDDTANVPLNIVTYANGQLTVPAAAFGQHVGANPLTPGDYTAQIMFFDGVNFYFDYYTNFTLTSGSGSNPNVDVPPTTLPPTGDNTSMTLLVIVLGVLSLGTLCVIGWYRQRKTIHHG
jgi:hypothetical protein